MVIIVTLAILLLAFYFFRRHSGAALLAVIAGLAVYELFGAGFAAQIHIWIPGSDLFIIDKIIYFLLIFIFPLLLYIRSGHGGLHGLFRLVHCIALALVVTSLLAQPLSEIFAFDTLATDIASWIHSARGGILLVAILGAYLDILFSTSST